MCYSLNKKQSISNNYTNNNVKHLIPNNAIENEFLKCYIMYKFISLMILWAFWKNSKKNLFSGYGTAFENNAIVFFVP